MYLGSAVDRQWTQAEKRRSQAAFVMIKNIWASKEINNINKETHRQFGTLVRLWGLQEDQSNPVQDTDLHQHLSKAYLQHNVVRKNQIWRHVTESRTGPSLWADHEAEVGLDWSRTPKTVIQHHETGHDMEPSKERKTGRLRNSCWRSIHTGRAHGDDIERGREGCPYPVRSIGCSTRIKWHEQVSKHWFFYSIFRSAL